MKRQALIPGAREAYEKELPPEEFNRLLQAALADDEELEARAELVRWFVRRYPTARERLAYARRKYRQLVESPLRAPLVGAVEELEKKRRME